jgi:Acyclic terpene utilisation family protein AtuA
MTDSPPRKSKPITHKGAEPMNRPIRIANCSGFYGDRLSAVQEMLSGPVDVLTVDYLAELTMLILWKARRRDPDSATRLLSCA